MTIRTGLQRYLATVADEIEQGREHCQRYQMDYRSCGLRLFQTDRTCFSLVCDVCGYYGAFDAPDMMVRE